MPANLIHVDINPEVFNRNYPAKVTIEGDAAAVGAALLLGLKGIREPRGIDSALQERIRSDKAAYRAEWYAHNSKGRVIV